MIKQKRKCSNRMAVETKTFFYFFCKNNQVISFQTFACKRNCTLEMWSTNFNILIPFIIASFESESIAENEPPHMITILKDNYTPD